MKKYEGNGYFCDDSLANAHLSYKGRSVIVDYEKALHVYPKCIRDIDCIVPCELYPYAHDTLIVYAKVDPVYNKVDMEQLIELLEVELELESDIQYEL